MTLTVRLDDALEDALERYCASTGSSKSRVVQESLATYLLNHASEASAALAVKEPSAAYKAFAEAGFIGAIALGGGSADKQAVRERMQQRLTRKRAARP